MTVAITQLWEKCSFMMASRNFHRRKFLRIGDFRGENFHGLFAFATPKDTMAPKFVEKTFANSHKTTRNSQKFSSLKVYRYTVLCS